MPAAAALAGLTAAAASLPLAACALLAARAFGRAAVRYRLLGAAFGLVAAVAPLALAAAVLRPAASAALGGGAAAAAVAAVAATGYLDGLARPLALAAAAVAALLLLGLALDVVRVLRVKRRAAPLGSAPVRGARLGASAAVATPTAIGYLHPAVIVPAGFRDRVDAGEWDAVLAHECAHLARGDDWAKAVQSLLLRAGWWLPGLWLLGRALDLERELASDERAAGAAGARRYAACLLRLATDRCSDVAPALWGRRAHLAIRVERLLRPAGTAGPVIRAAALGAFTATGLAAVLGALVAVPGTHVVPLRHAAEPSHRLAAHSLAARSLRRPVARHDVAAATARPVPHAVPPARSSPRPVAAVRVPAAASVVAALPARAPAALAAAAAASPAVATSAALASAPRSAAALVPRSAALAAARRAHRAASSRLAPRTVAWVRLPRRPCPTCWGPKRSADDAFGPATGLAPHPADAEPGGGGTSDPVGITVLWIRLPSPAPNP